MCRPTGWRSLPGQSLSGQALPGQALPGRRKRRSSRVLLTPARTRGPGPRLSLRPTRTGLRCGRSRATGCSREPGRGSLTVRPQAASRQSRCTRTPPPRGPGPRTSSPPRDRGGPMRRRRRGARRATDGRPSLGARASASAGRPPRCAGVPDGALDGLLHVVVAWPRQTVRPVVGERVRGSCPRTLSVNTARRVPLVWWRLLSPPVRSWRRAPAGRR